MAPRTKMITMREWLRDRLADGAVPAIEIFNDGAEHGYPVRTLRKVKKELGVEVFRAGNHWYWELPPPPEPKYPTTQEWCRYCGTFYRRAQPKLHLGERTEGPCPEHEQEVRELNEAAQRRKRKAIEDHRKRVREWEEQQTAALNHADAARQESEAEKRDRRMRQLGLDNPVPEARTVAGAPSRFPWED
ncbi:hypothetical protein SAMN06265360_1078 [Haloechinothrix alba]|uniref:Uncharacterized protein n=1 Tax=Haloechinothrix alba TaxID=664784 RepID=A0A238WN49_9PSEU|nr:hypothetical protein SAMN06265360_1078 [Haloechinothrix alba]